MKRSPSEKIVSRERLASLLSDLKQQGWTIVSTNGSFDLLHIGHVTMLEEAKSLGDVLVVGLNSDTSIQGYKGKYRPICPQRHRAAMLAALACTDYITIFDELTPLDLLDVIRPHIHVNSPEHGKDCIEREVVERYGGRVHLAQLVEDISTTELIGRIVEGAKHPPRRGAFLNASDLLAEFEKTSEYSHLTENIFSSLNLLISEGFEVCIFLREQDEQRIRSAVLPPQTALYPLRQPKRDLMLQAADTYNLILAKSIMMSSDPRDILLGRELNCKTFWLQIPHRNTRPWPYTVGPHVILEHVVQIQAYLS